MKSLNEDIKTGQFKNVYLLYGEEAYLKRQYRDRLRRAMLPEGDTMNYACYEGKNIPEAEVIDLAETMPFFAERRLIVIENSDFFKNSSSGLADYIKTMPDTTCMIFTENEVDKRSRMYRAVSGKGRAVELTRQDERTLMLWIAGAAKREKKKMRESAARCLLDMAGTDMENLEKELEKLFCYTLDRDEITAEDVEAVCTAQTANRIFDMVEAVAMKRQKKALDYYYDLLALREPPMRILYLLTRQFRILLEVRALTERGYARNQVAESVGLRPFVAGKYMEQCRSFTSGELQRILEDAADLEESVKTGRLNDVMSVELFIVRHSAA